MAMLQTERILNALVEIGRIGPYYPRTFNKETGYSDLDLETEIQPLTSYANEVGGTFGPAPEHKRRLVADIKDWTFELRLTFNQHASLETWWRNICDQPPRIDKDEEAGLRQVLIFLTGGRFEHPWQQQPQAGTKAWITFQAHETPK